MKLNLKNNKAIELISIVLLSSFVFILTTGGGIIDFNNVAWLFGSSSLTTDSEQHYIAWLFLKILSCFNFLYSKIMPMEWKLVPV